jgi:hypothetical protein
MLFQQLVNNTFHNSFVASLLTSRDNPVPITSSQQACHKPTELQIHVVDKLLEQHCYNFVNKRATKQAC